MERGFLSQGTSDKELMGMQGEVLFADPLNVRGGSAKAQAGWGAGQKATASKMHNDPWLAPEQKQEQEQNWLTSFFWSVVAGGEQCCAMRSRGGASDAAKKADELGRPPARFPEPPRDAHQEKADAALAGLQKRNLPTGRVPISDSESESDDYRPRQAPQAQAWKAPTSGGDLKKASASAGRSPAEQRGSPLGGGYGSPLNDRGNGASSSSAMPARLEAWNPEKSSMLLTGSMKQESDVPVFKGPASAPPPAAPAKVPLKAEGPRRWEWPAFCLNFKQPCIEVYVVDEETNAGRWVRAEPQSRVVDKAGRDAYLCVEYDWDGEDYVQDFGPQHVRKIGQTMTVFQMLEKTAGLEETVTMERDGGGGVSSFLRD